MKFFHLILLLFCTTSIFPIEESENKKYVWPLNIDNGYSSAFQEFRSNHFHAGIDLRTYQKTGYPVYAISGGRLNKLRIVKRGSGRGLYIKHLDGKISIYFHLEKFAPKIEKIAQKVQKARGQKYFGNYILKNPLYITRGEIIGFSGETGYGFPHLHLEIRDRDYYAVNPFKWLKLPGKDANYPVIKALLLRMKGSTLINGNIGQKELKFKRSNNHSFHLLHSIVTTGNFDFVVNIRDISDTGKYVAPYKVSAVIDDKEYFQLRFDRFAWSDNNQLGFVYDMFNSSPGNYFFNLFFQKGFELEEKQLFFDDVIDQLNWGRHTGKILVEDNYGNISVGHFVIFKIKKPEIEIQNVQVEGGQISLDIKKMSARFSDEISVQLKNKNNKMLYSGLLDETYIPENMNFILKGISDKIYFLDFIFYKSGVPYYKKRFLLDNSLLNEIDDIKFDTYINRDDIIIIPKGYEFSSDNILLNVIQGVKSQIILPQDSVGGIFFQFKLSNTNNNVRLEFIILKEKIKTRTIQKDIKLINLQDGIKQNFRDGDFTAEFDTRTVKESRVLKFELKNFSSNFPVLSRQVSLSPYHFPFLDMVKYKFKKNIPEPEQVGIFKYNFRKKKWGYVYTKYDTVNKIYSTKVISSGTFALMRDIFYPEIGLMRLRSHFLSKLKLLIVKITDRGKGVNDTSLKVLLNRKNVDCEYDPDWRYVEIEDLRALRPGNNILKVQVDDWAGNRSSRTFYLKLK